MNFPYNVFRLTEYVTFACILVTNSYAHTHTYTITSVGKILLRMLLICHIRLSEMMTWNKMVISIDKNHSKVLELNIRYDCFSLLWFEANNQIQIWFFISKIQNGQTTEFCLRSNSYFVQIRILRIRLCHRSCVSLKMKCWQNVNGIKPTEQTNKKTT